MNKRRAYRAWLLLLLLAVALRLDAAAPGATQLRKATLKGNTMAAWAGLLACSMENGFDVRKELTLYLREDRMPMSSFNHLPGVVLVPDMCGKEQGDAFWGLVSSLWTQDKVDLKAMFANEKASRHGANLWVVSLMAREFTHFLDRRHPTRTISPGQYFWRGSRLAMAFLRHGFSAGPGRPVLTRHFALLRAWQAQVRPTLDIQIQAGDDPDSLALRHGISFRPDGAATGAKLATLQLAMDLYWWRADSGMTLRQVMGSLGIGAQSSLPLYPGIIGIDAGREVPSHNTAPCAGNQGPKPTDAGVALRSDGQLLIVSILDDKPGDKAPNRAIQVMQVENDKDFKAIGQVELRNWSVGTPAAVADVAVLPGNGAAVVLRKGSPEYPSWRLYKLDLNGHMVEDAIGLDNWYQVPRGDTSGRAPTKLLAAPDGTIYLLKIAGQADSKTDFALYRLARDGSKADQVQRFSAEVGQNWFWAVDYAVDDRGRLWIADDARGRILLADGGMLYNAVGCLRGFAAGPGAAAQLYTVGMMGWDADGTLLVYDQYRELLPSGQVKLKPVVRKIRID